MERCLLTTDEGDKCQVDDRMQELGREVIREVSKHMKCTIVIGSRRCIVALQNLEVIEK